MAKKRRSRTRSETVGADAATLPPGVKLLRTLAGHKAPVRSVAFDPQGHTLASGSDNGTVKLWDAGSVVAQCDSENSCTFETTGGDLWTPVMAG